MVSQPISPKIPLVAQTRHGQQPWKGWAAGLALASLLGVQTVTADPPKRHWRDQPGYFPLETLGILAREDLSVEINLQGAMLRMVAGAVRAAEPDFAGLIENLAAVRVHIAPGDKLDLAKVSKRIRTATDWLEDNNWQAIVRTRDDDDDETYVYSHETDGEIDGMAILVMEPTEVAVINIIGGIDLEQIERLGETLDLPLLPSSSKDEPSKDAESSKDAEQEEPEP